MTYNTSSSRVSTRIALLLALIIVSTVMLIACPSPDTDTKYTTPSTSTSSQLQANLNPSTLQEMKEIKLKITRKISKSRDTTIKWMVEGAYHYTTNSNSWHGIICNTLINGRIQGF